nr:hypothetical protein Itr_chr07CG15890 [Ipomoea trifida]
MTGPFVGFFLFEKLPSTSTMYNPLVCFLIRATELIYRMSIIVVMVTVRFQFDFEFDPTVKLEPNLLKVKFLYNKI